MPYLMADFMIEPLLEAKKDSEAVSLPFLPLLDSFILL